MFVKINRQLVWSLALIAGSLGVGLSAAQTPSTGVNPGRHPNLAAAQDLAARASQRVAAAQQANEWDMNGHAQRARELLDQANRELGMAAGSANRR